MYAALAGIGALAGAWVQGRPAPVLSRVKDGSCAVSSNGVACLIVESTLHIVLDANKHTTYSKK